MYHFLHDGMFYVLKNVFTFQLHVQYMYYKTNRTHIQNVGKYLDTVKNKWFSKIQDM
jgi:hypothetical protein